MGNFAEALSNTGLLFADDLRRLRGGDLVIILAYGRIYAELAALLDEIARLRMQSFLITDTLADTLRLRVDCVLPVIILIEDPLKPQHAASTMGPGLRSAS